MINPRRRWPEARGGSPRSPMSSTRGDETLYLTFVKRHLVEMLHLLLSDGAASTVLSKTQLDRLGFIIGGGPHFRSEVCFRVVSPLFGVFLTLLCRTDCVLEFSHVVLGCRQPHGSCDRNLRTSALSLAFVYASTVDLSSPACRIGLTQI